MDAGGGRAVARVGGRPSVAIAQAGAGGIALDVREGATDPMQGWHSSQYGKKVPALALEYARTGASTSFATVLGTGPYALSPPTVREAVPGRAG